MVIPSDMQKIEIIALNQDKLGVLSELQNLGIMQITFPTEDLTKKLPRSEPPEIMSELSECLIKVSRIKSALEIVDVKETFVQNILNLDLPEKVEVDRKDTKTLINETKEFLNKYGKGRIELDNLYHNSLEKINNLKNQRKVAEILSEAEAPLPLMRDTKNVKMHFGVVEIKSLEKLDNELRKETEGFVNLIVVEKDKKLATILVLSLKEKSENVSMLLNKNKFIALTLPDVPAGKKNILEFIDEEIGNLENKVEDIKKKFLKYRKQFYKKVVVLRELLEIKEEKQKTIHQLVESKKSFFMHGWVETKKLQKITESLSKVTKKRVAINKIEPEKEEEPPVKMKNPNWLKPFEMLTELYALPKYKDIDPTFIVGPIFVIFAGFMLTDFVYGLGLVLLGWFMLSKLVKYNEGLKGASVNILLMGIISMIFGVLTGSYLGDALKVLLEKLKIMTAAQYAATFVIWRDPLVDPLYFLIISMGVAIIHINIGLIIGTIEGFRRKDYKNIITSKAVWFILQIAVLLFYLKMNLPAIILLVLVVIIIIYAEGPIGILGITGFMGDVISYSRLFALALSTAGIAMTVNLLTTLVLDIPYAGIVAAILIFIIGHLFSFLMNSLGSFVHGIRLQFVEFFGKFYEGGGDKFEPFTEKRKYTSLSSKNG